MGRKVRDATLETPQARLKLKALQRHWRGVEEGLALGYRRGTQGAGTWSARVLLEDGRYTLRAIGDADDQVPANGKKVLTLAQAQKRAIAAAALMRAIAAADQMKRDAGTDLTPASVAEAAQKYLAWFAAQPATARNDKLGKTSSKSVVSALAVLNKAFCDGRVGR